MNKSPHTPLALIILDGWGHRAEKKDNGIELAQKPFFDSLLKKYPHTLIDASGPSVGLPEGVMGNSEVGHMNLGAGRIVYSGLSQIFEAIRNKSFFKNPALQHAINHLKKSGGYLHLMGLVSDGSVHSHQDHLLALLEMAKIEGVKNVAVHAFLDGRDTAPRDGIKYIKNLIFEMNRMGVGQLASVSGRFFAMDRDQRWDRTEKAFAAIRGIGPQFSDAAKKITEEYAKNIGDEFIEPFLVNPPSKKIDAQDAVVFFNFRADRAKQLSFAFTQKDFPEFSRGDDFKSPGVYVCMSPYDDAIQADVAFRPEYPQKTFGEVVANNGLMQLRLAETEKYAHVTFFFNGGRDVKLTNEERILVPSPRDVPTYDLKPEMSARVIKSTLLEKMKGDSPPDVAVVNFANTDMVGHTAISTAILKSVHVVDECLSEIIPAYLEKNGVVVITADHGNAEEMVDENGEPMTKHTIHQVPFILIGNEFAGQVGEDILILGGRLCDVAPTLLHLLHLEIPPVMTGHVLLRS